MTTQSSHSSDGPGTGAVSQYGQKLDELASRGSMPWKEGNVRLVVAEDAGEVRALIQACAEGLSNKFGASHWLDHFTNKDGAKAWDITYFQGMIERDGTIGVVLESMKGGIIGCCFLTRTPADYYEEEVPGGLRGALDNTVFITKLAIHPDYQGRGLGTDLCKFVIGLVGDEGSTTIELDAVTSIPNLEVFYGGLGFKTFHRSELSVYMRLPSSWESFELGEQAQLPEGSV